MEAKYEKILVVDDDSAVLDLIAHQALKSARYETRVANDVNSALNELQKFKPDLIIASLHMPGLNARDLLAVLKSHNDPTPLIVVAEQGQEQKVIQTFRLGATDTLQWPAHEPEVINIVERVLQQIRMRKEREEQLLSLARTNEGLHNKIEELFAVFKLGKAVTGVIELPMIFSTIVDNAVEASNADLGWLMIRDDLDQHFILAATKNLPDSYSANLNQPWDDGISSSVAKSGATFNGVGDKLAGKKIGFLGEAVLVVPIRVSSQVIGLMVVMRRQAVPFLKNDQEILEALADFSSIALINAYRCHAAEDKSRRLKKKVDLLDFANRVSQVELDARKNELSSWIMKIQSTLESFSSISSQKLTADQQNSFELLREQSISLRDSVHLLDPDLMGRFTESQKPSKINEIIESLIQKLKPVFTQNRIQLVVDPIPDELIVTGFPGIANLLIEGILSLAARVGKTNSQVGLSARKSSSNFQVLVDVAASEINAGQLLKADIGSSNLSGDAKLIGNYGNPRLLLEGAAIVKGQLNFTEPTRGEVLITLTLPENLRN